MIDEQDEREPPVIVPHTALSREALEGVIEAFVLREGTDYGEREVPHGTKCLQVRRQLERGEARIVFDPASDTVSIERVEPGSGPTRPRPLEP